MQLSLTRQEIRRQIRAMLGQVTTEATAAGDQEQLNAFIDASSLKAHGDCRWQLSQRRVTVDLGEEQYKVPYPADCALGGVTQMAVWDESGNQYRPLVRTVLPVVLDFDQLEAEGGDAYRAIQGIPEYFENRNDFVYLWRPNNQTARKLRIAYSLRMTFVNDQQVSTVDAMAIIYWALAMKYKKSGDDEGCDDARKLYTDRVGELRAWANSGHAIEMDSSATFNDINSPDRPTPNWDTSPRTV